GRGRGQWAWGFSADAGGSRRRSSWFRASRSRTNASTSMPAPSLMWLPSRGPRAPAPPRGGELHVLSQELRQLLGERLAGDDPVAPLVEGLRGLPQYMGGPAQHRRGPPGVLDLPKGGVQVEP